MRLSGYSLIAANCRESFQDFVQEFGPAVIGAPLVWNWHMEFLCDELQTIAERVFAGEDSEYDLIVNIPPGTTKSTIASVLFHPWTWTRMPEARHLVATHTDQLALDLSRKSRDIILSPKYQSCFPGLDLREDQNTKGYYLNTKGGSRLSATVGGKNPMGFHAHFINVDDPIDPQKVLSEAALKEANDFMNHTLPSRKVDKLVTVTSLIMQRLGQNDCTGNLLAQIPLGLKLRHVCLPSELTDRVAPKYLRKKYIDGLLDPIRLSESALAQYKIKGDYYYSGQFLQNPIPPGGGMFQTNMLGVGVSPPPQSSFKKIIRYWDNAGTKDGNGAYTCGVKIGETWPIKGEPWGHFWVLDVKRGRWEANERERTKKQVAILDTRVVKIGQEQEPGSSGKDVARWTIRQLAGFHVIRERATGDKADRAGPFSGMVNAGYVHLAPGQWNAEYMAEMDFFPYSTFKDQIDASSGAFNLLTRAIKVGAM